MPWEGAPRSHTQCKAHTCPVIDSYCAIAKVRDSPIHRRRYRRVFERVGMHDDGCIERSPELLIDEINGAVDVFSDTGRFEGRLGEEATESLCGEAHIVCVGWINPRDQRPG